MCKINSVLVHDENKVFKATLYFNGPIFNKNCNYKYISSTGELFNAAHHHLEDHPETDTTGKGNKIYNAYHVGYDPLGGISCKECFIPGLRYCSGTCSNGFCHGLCKKS